MAQTRKHLCGTPPQHCTGNQTQVSFGIRGSTSPKTHTSPPEAFNCHRRWLVREEGYVQVGPREFQKDGGAVLILTKKSRFGGELRPGKTGEKSQGKRFEPKSGGGIIL